MTPPRMLPLWLCRLVLVLVVLVVAGAVYLAYDVRVVPVPTFGGVGR